MTSIELRALQGQKRAAHMRWAQPPATVHLKAIGQSQVLAKR